MSMFSWGGAVGVTGVVAAAGVAAAGWSVATGVWSWDQPLEGKKKALTIAAKK
jgi:hypothetical protein